MLSSAALAMYLVEFLKGLFRMLTKDQFYEFPPKVLAALLVVANAVSVLILAVLDVEGYELPVDWVGWLKALIIAVLGAVISSALYVVGYLPFRAYLHDFNAARKAKSKSKK